jgi:hypothetical protein
VKACGDEEKSADGHDRRTHGKPPEPTWLGICYGVFFVVFVVNAPGLITLGVDSSWTMNLAAGCRAVPCQIEIVQHVLPERADAEARQNAFEVSARRNISHLVKPRPKV